MAGVDVIYLDTSDTLSEITDLFCGYLFGEFESHEDDDPAVGIDVSINRISLNIKEISIPQFVIDGWQRQFGFTPTKSISVYYAKFVDDVYVRSAENTANLRNIIIPGIAELIQQKNYNLALSLDDRHTKTLVNFAGTLTLFNESFWTEDRLKLLKDLKYQFEDGSG